MKRVIKFLPIAAIVLGSGLALATTSVVSTPNVYWDGSSWQTLTTTSYSCIDVDDHCTAYKDSQGQIQNASRGQFVPN